MRGRPSPLGGAHAGSCAIPFLVSSSKHPRPRRGVSVFTFRSRCAAKSPHDSDPPPLAPAGGTGTRSAYPTLEWLDWFNNRRLLEPIGNVPPAELEASYYQSTSQLPMAA